MQPLRAALMGAALMAGCSSPLLPHAAGAIPLTITASGEACGPWWYGCALYASVKPAGWNDLHGWRPGIDDSLIVVDLRVSESPMLVTGVRQGPISIGPGSYRILVLDNSVGDVPPTVVPDPRILCSVDATIIDGTTAVALAVTMDAWTCSLKVAVTGPSPS